MALTMMARPVAGSNLNPMSQKSVRLTAARSGQAAGRIEAHEFFRSVVLLVDREEIFGGFDIASSHLDCFEDASIEGEQVRGEGELGFIESGHFPLGTSATWR